jgi:hypothetical protein
MKSESGASGWQRAGDEISPDPAPGHRALASGELSTAWELDEFFQALGTVLRLPPKSTGPAGEHEVVPKGARSPRRPMKLVLAALGLLALAAGHEPLLRLLTHDRRVPDAFYGRWETRAEKYAGRGFIMSGDSLRLEQGAGRMAVYPIDGVLRNAVADTVWYTVRYRDGASLLEMGLRLETDSTLRLANLPSVLWSRVEP